MSLLEGGAHAFAILATFATLVACESPGEGPKARSGFQHSTAIVQALEEYRNENGRYPEALDALVPTHLSGAAIQAPPETRELRYHATGNGYELGFAYSGPGTNLCSYSSESKLWKCYGAY